MDFETIVIGAGPAGFAYCASPSSAGQRILLIEAGKPLVRRDSTKPTEIAQGVGGAGPFIDGKFSFFPAGTELWKVPYETLAKAYADLEKLMATPIPPCPSRAQIRSYLASDQSAGWNLKRYPSIYLDFGQRFLLLHRLEKAARRNATLLCETRVLSVSRHASHFVVNLKGREITCSRVIMSGGRFMPMTLEQPFPMRFRRVEFGLRLELPHTNRGLQRLAATGLLDPKFVSRPSASVQFRTFCFCKRGMVCKSSIDGIETFSGRADVAPTEFSNLGLMARSTDPSAFDEADLDCFLVKPFKISVGDLGKLEAKLIAHCGKAGSFLWLALDHLLQEFPELNCPELTLYGPCLEGVGAYPDIDHSFQVRGTPDLYAIGDASGILRGLVPSLLNGFYLARSLEAIQISDL